MCFKYEEEYGVCFDGPFCYRYLNEDFWEYLNDAFNIQVRDKDAEREISDDMYKLFEKWHESGMIKPRGKK